MRTLGASAIALAILVASATPSASRMGAAHRAYFAGDFEQAASLAARSAQAGDGSAQLLLGMMYKHGRGVSKDLVTAHMWLSLAVANGELFAQVLRAELIDLMTADEIQKAHQMLFERVSRHEN